MQINSVVAFGCSNTYGEALVDCWQEQSPGVWNAGPQPSARAWPSLVAHHFKSTVKNYSAPGISNTLIAHRALNTQIKSNSLVLVGWSYPNRQTIIKNDNTEWRRTTGFNFVENPDFISIGPWQIDNPRWKSHRKIAQLYYRYFHNNINGQLESLRLIELVDSYVWRSGATPIHVLCDRFDIAKPQWVRSHWISTTIEDVCGQYPVALDNMHPGELAHKHIADCVIQYAQGKYKCTPCA